MAVRLREALATLPRYVGGRTVPNAIKLASNETPYPALPHVVARLTDSLRAANRYPDPTSSKLTAALAERYDLPVTQVVVGCGSVSLCQQLVQISTQVGDEVVYGWRAFEAYPVVAAIAGAVHARVPLRDEVHDLPAMADAVTDATRLVFVCNPNNPTGTAVRGADLKAFLAAVPEHVLVVIDEAYHEFVTDPDVPDGRMLLDDHPNLVVLRTFSKAYGLAGLRVGYALAGDQAVAAALKQVQVPFAVSRVAQDAALACLDPDAEKELFTRVDTVLAERSRVMNSLRGLGYAVPPTQANFVWLALGGRTADWATGCAEQGVIVRPFAGEGVRVTIGAPDENDQFLRAARALAG